MAVQLFENFGFSHITERIFSFLDTETLLACRQVNRSWNAHLSSSNRTFWFKKLASDGMAPEIQARWKKIISEVYNYEEKDGYSNYVLERSLELSLFKMQASDFFQSPLEQAVELGQTEFVKFILEKSEFVINDLTKMAEYGFQLFPITTPFHLAAQWGHAEILKMLIDTYENCNGNLFIYAYCINRNYDTPLHVAIKWGRTEIVKILADKFSETSDSHEKCINVPGDQGSTPLHLIALYDEIECLEFITPYIKFWEIQDYSGLTPLNIARIYNNYEIADYIEEECKHQLMMIESFDDPIHVSL